MKLATRAIVTLLLSLAALTGAGAQPFEKRSFQSSKPEVRPQVEPSPVEVQSGIRAHIDGVMKRNNNLFPIYDPRAKKQLLLEFVKINSGKVSVMRARKKGTNTYFSCVEFKDPANGTIYDLDFWTKRQPNGKVRVTATKIHMIGGQPRFTYEKDRITDLPNKN